MEKNGRNLAEFKNIFEQIPFLKNYYSDVYRIELDLSEIVFPNNSEFPVIMVDDLSQDEDQIMDCIQKFFSKPDSPVNLYKYLNPVASHIDREAENKQIRHLQSGLVVFAHTGEDKIGINYEHYAHSATREPPMKYREYLRVTGFSRYIKGYFMDRVSVTLTSSVWTHGSSMLGTWDEGRAGLCANCCDVHDVYPLRGCREIFQQLRQP